MTRVREVLDRVANGRLCVVGDVMLDEFLFGVVERISPEAPVPVFAHQRSVQRVGGGGCAAFALVGLCARVEVVGSTGDDEEGALVAALLRDQGVKTELVVDPSRHTIRKTRVVAQGQHMLRLDREAGGDLAPQAGKLLVDAVVAAVDQADAVLVSDYAKGTCGRRLAAVTLSRARDRGIPVVVDSKRPDILRYLGATAVTPNEKELAGVARHLGYPPDDLSGAADRLRHDGRFDWVVVTRAEQGMTVFGGDAAEHFPARATTVADVAGAGDALAGALALALGSGLGVSAAGNFASLVAALFIRNREDKTITPDGVIDFDTRHGAGGS